MEPLILVVEDEVVLLRLFTRTLKEEGYEVISACDGARALNLIEERGAQIDLLIADIVLPGVSGIRLGYELKRRSATARVLLISGYSHFEGDENGFPVLPKPFEVNEFLEKIEATLGLDGNGEL